MGLWSHMCHVGSQVCLIEQCDEQCDAAISIISMPRTPNNNNTRLAWHAEEQNVDISIAKIEIKV